MIGNVFEYLGNPSLGLYWLKGRVIAIILLIYDSVHLNSCKSMLKPYNYVSAFVLINVCPPPFFGKMFTKSTDINRVGPPPPPSIIDLESCEQTCDLYLPTSLNMLHIVLLHNKYVLF